MKFFSSEEQNLIFQNSLLALVNVASNLAYFSAGFCNMDPISCQRTELVARGTNIHYREGAGGDKLFNINVWPETPYHTKTMHFIVSI